LFIITIFFGMIGISFVIRAMPESDMIRAKLGRHGGKAAMIKTCFASDNQNYLLWDG
jgi:hypothetical protein